ncbi:MAG: cob(I)yrinic acid a,c-diamide adenosyltransferase [Ignavibacteriales bacterium]|nr:cob(I)yrinic acid a,c-diamide adenosyltransferase [Ignavibacteriales bacterium]
MKIYTKTGDKGETSLLGGRRVPKDSLRIEAYGTVDELNTVLGICRSINIVKKIDTIIEDIQNDLFQFGTELASPTEYKSNSAFLSSSISRLEKSIDEIEPKLEPLKNFILPGGNKTASMLHFARTVCRRTERFVVRLSHEETVHKNSIVYLNRLSDLLFILARWTNTISNTSEQKWIQYRSKNS